MKAKKKSLFYVIVVLLVMIESITVFLMYKSSGNKNVALDNVSLKDKIKNNSGIAIMLDQGDGTYLPSDSNTFPTGMTLNREKSGCLDNLGQMIPDSITYEGGIANVSVDVTSFCYLFFDNLKDIVVNVSTNGVAGLPTINKYKAELTCNGAQATFNNKYQRLEFSSVNSSQTSCNLNYVNDTNSYTYLIDKVESEATDLGIATVTIDDKYLEKDVGFRYVEQANNWIWFNNEMWRIIGSIPTCMNSDCSTIENLVKIVRSAEIGGLSYHTSENHTKEDMTWGNGNTLYTLLNEYYYGKQDATGENICRSYGSDAICNYTTKGISNDEKDFYGKMIQSVYMNVGAIQGISITSREEYDKTYILESETITSQSARVGLMNASDYQYSISSDTTYTSWAYGYGDEWTMNLFENIWYPAAIGNSGSVNNNHCNIGNSVRPAVYLDQRVYIKGGDGTENNPYIIAM